MAKCKICGARMDDGAAKCPMCGAAAGATAESLQPKPQDQPRPQARQTPPVQQQWQQPPVQPVQQTVTVQMPPPPVSPQASGDATDDELINAYITGNAGGIPTTTHALEHYRNAFREDFSWNWATAFTSAMNLFYRRCWGWALLTYVISWLCTLIIPGGALASYIGFFIIMGLAGDRIICSRFKRTVQRAFSLYPGNKNSQLSYVAGQGGTRTALVITIIVVSLICAIILCLAYGVTFLYLLGGFMEEFGWLN